MKRFLSGLLLLIIFALSYADLPPMTQDPVTAGVAASSTPAQVFQQANSGAVPSAVPATTTSTQQMVSAEVKRQAQVKAANNLHQQVQNLKQVQELEDRFTQFTQAYLLTQQENKQELALLTQKTMALQSEIEQLMGVLKSLSAQVDQTKVQMATQHYKLEQLAGNSIQAALTKASGFINNENNTVLMLVLLALLILWLLVHRIRKHKVALKAQQSSSSSNDDDTKNEYDFMGSSEGIPAQLDLARAYMAMENYVAANAVLQRVVAKGDAIQQQQAKELLAKIPEER